MSLTIGSINLKSANFNGVSSLPSISNLSNIQQLSKSLLEEDSNVFFRYGFLSCIFPYKMQDKYDRATDVKEYKTVTLENEYLKAVFLPEFGGRMWSLFDKKKGKELLSKWILIAQNSRLNDYQDCATTIQNWSKSIFNTFDFPYTNGFTEGCNNKIKVLKRNAYGYRNFNRFRKRILHMFNYKKSNIEKVAA